MLCLLRSFLLVLILSDIVRYGIRVLIFGSQHKIPVTVMHRVPKQPPHGGRPNSVYLRQVLGSPLNFGA
jgi:hypothetical protein